MEKRFSKLIRLNNVTPRVKCVQPNANFTLTLTFTNNERRVFDVTPYLEAEFFRELRDATLFNTVRPYLGSIQWIHGQDFCPDHLYAGSVPISDRRS